MSQIDILAGKEYTYTYEEGRIVRATEAVVQLTNEMVTHKVITHTVRYDYNTEGVLTKKVIAPGF